MLLALLLACDPCGQPVAIADPDGALSADARALLVEAHEDWQAWTGADQVCLSRVRVRQLDDDGYELAGRVLELDPDHPYGALATRWALCSLLEEREDHAGLRPDLFDDEDDFRRVCSRGPQDWAWREQVQAGCGGDLLDARTTYMADQVYPLATPGRVDGTLQATVGPALHLLDSEGGTIYGFAGLGEQLLLRRYQTIDEVRRDALWLVDPHTRAAEQLWEEEDPGSVELVGGTEQAVALVRGGEQDRLLVVEPDGVVAQWPFEGISVTADRTVAHGALWGQDSAYQTSPLVRIDLATGQREEVELPAPKPGLERLVSGLAEVEGGLFVETYDASVEIGTDSIGIIRYGFESWLLELDGHTWAALTRDLHLLEAGDADSLALGTVFSDAGRVLAAYDTAGDRLLVSGDQCLGDDYALLSTGHTVWMVYSESDGLVFQGYALGW